MKARLENPASQAERLATYLDRLSRVAGHADRIAPMQSYTKGLFLPIERKSVEPMAARLAPASVRQMHQSLHHIVAEAAWSDGAWLREVRCQVLPAMTRKHALAAWIVDDTGFPKKGSHSVGVTRQYCGQLGKQETAGLRSACRWPPSRPVCLSPTSCTCLKSGRKTQRDETRPAYRKKSAFKPSPRWRSSRFAGWSKRVSHTPRCWPTPPMATTTDSAMACHNCSWNMPWACSLRPQCGRRAWLPSPPRLAAGWDVRRSCSGGRRDINRFRSRS